MRRIFAALGLVRNVRSFGPIDVQFSYNNFVIGKFLSAKGLAQKFRSMFYGPGFTEKHPKHRLGRPEDLPKVDPNYKVYDPKIRRVSKLAT